MAQESDYKKTILRWQLPQSGSLTAQLLNWSRLQPERLKDLIELGSVYCNDKRIMGLKDASRIFKEGSSIRIHSEPRRCTVDDIDWSKRMIYETSNFLAFDKPAGLPTHPMVDNWKENALIQLELHSGVKLFVTHRLDRATEGLLIIAKNIEFQRLFNQVLQDDRTEKFYRAKVDCQLAPGTPQFLDHWMLRSKSAPKKILPTEDQLSKEQFDQCRLEIIDEDKTLLEIKLHTGRTHQIRAQLSFLGSPIFGDSLYGSVSQFSPGQICLQSAAIHFTDPISQERLIVKLPEPNWFQA